MFNDVEITQKTIDFASKYLGRENVVELDERMTAEDFAYFSQKVPSCFYRLGVSNKHDKKRYGLHNSRFNPDEKSLLIGYGLMSWIAINHLIANARDKFNSQKFYFIITEFILFKLFTSLIKREIF